MTSNSKKTTWHKDDCLEIAARIGYAVRGVVYIMIGLLAFTATFTNSHHTEGSKGVLKVLALQPYGHILLILITTGFACYALWRLLSAILDIRNRGNTLKGLWARISDLATGTANGVLAYYAAQLVWGATTRNGATRTQMTIQVLSVPFGEWAIGLCGMAIGGAGLYQCYRAWRGAFMRRLMETMPPSKHHIANITGRIGLMTRGIIFLLIGLLFIRAAHQHDASDVGGLQKALQTLLEQPYGPWLLCLASLGLICYGLSCFTYARYRRFHIDFDKKAA